MRDFGQRFWSACIVCLAVAPLAAAQPSAREIELARTFAHDHKAGPAAYPVTLETLRRGFDRQAPPVSDEIEAWMLGNFPAVQASTLAGMEKDMKTRIADALAERFSEAGLELLVASQAYLRQPQFVSAVDAPDLTSAQKIEALRQALSPEEFETFIRTATAPQLVAVPGLLQRVAVAFSTEYTERLNDAFRERCASAPPIALCEADQAKGAIPGRSGGLSGAKRRTEIPCST